MNVSRRLTCLTLSVGLMTLLPGTSMADDRPAPLMTQRATWQIPQADQVREQLFDWLESVSADASQQSQIEALWQSDAEAEAGAYLLDLVCASVALVDPRAGALAEYCAQPRRSVHLPEVKWLNDDAVSEWVRNNLRLYFGRWLVQELLYDEAREQLDGLEPQQVVDPSALLFYQSVVYHRTLDREAGLAAIARLLQHDGQIPKRFASLARLMQADLEGLKEDSLDHIARRMEDVRRRLDLGRAGPKVREVEDGVIASLDKLIEEMEKQQQAAAAAAAAAQGGGQQAPLQPLPDSMPLGGKGEGNVANKPIGDRSGWGDLPPKQRDEALQQIGQEFPAHYRDVIEQYFRKLATGDEPEK